MTAYEQAKLLVSRMSTLERLRLGQELLGRTAESGGRGIAITPNVCGGSARIEDTRIAVWLLEAWRRQGVSEAELLEWYPSLSAEDLAHAWEYVARHPEEIEEEIRRNSEDE